MAKSSKTRALASRLMHEVLVVLNENGGELLFRELADKIAARLSFDAWALEPASVDPRWQVVLRFYSIHLDKAGFVIKNRSGWFLTDSGREAISLDPLVLLEQARLGYVDWKRAQVVSSVPASVVVDEVEAVLDDDSHAASCGSSSVLVSPSLAFEDIKTKADEDIRSFIRSRNPYEFQQLVAALLRAMGYYTPFIAPKGKDGGIDIIAYTDPLGAVKPILKVQVKHYDLSNPVSVDVVRSLVGVCGSDYGIIVTSGRFAEDAKREARQKNVRLIDGSEFSELWIRFFDKMSENDKALMPIEPVFFIKRGE